MRALDRENLILLKQSTVDLKMVLILISNLYPNCIFVKETAAMTVLIEIPDNKQGNDWLKHAKSLSFVQNAKKVSASENNLLAEYAHIKRAHRLARQVKAGKIPTRPLSDLLNEL